MKSLKSIVMNENKERDLIEDMFKAISQYREEVGDILDNSNLTEKEKQLYKSLYSDLYQVKSTCRDLEKIYG